MADQRRHQRIRFNVPPRVSIGHFGKIGHGELENLSLGGLMLRTDLALTVGESIGCEFSVFSSPVIDMRALVVSRIGDLFGARFEAGPISEVLVEDAINHALASGKASVMSFNDLQGRKVMRVVGGLNGGLSNDFMHGLTKMGIDEIDLSGVTEIDREGLELCRLAVDKHHVVLGQMSPCVQMVWAGMR